MPAVNGVEVVINGTALIVIETELLTAVLERLSETRTVNVNTPADPPTVPLITPAELNDNPVGNVPELIIQLE